MSFFRKVSDSESESDSEEERMSDYEEDAEKKKSNGVASTPAKVSKFLRGSDSDSSSSEEESDDDSDESESEDSEGDKQKTAKKQSKFLRGAVDSDDSEEDVKKIVKSAKDKRVDEMDTIVRSLENAQRIDDWVAISKGKSRHLLKEVKMLMALHHQNSTR